MYYESKVFTIAERVEQAVLTMYSYFHQFLVTGQALSSSPGNAEKFCSGWQWYTIIVPDDLKIVSGSSYREFPITWMRLYLAGYHLVREGCSLLQSAPLQHVVNLLLSQK